LIFFVPLQDPDGGSDLPQDHLGYIARRGAQNGDRFYGVEVVDSLKVLRGEILSGVHAAPGQEHKSHTVFQRGFEPDLHAVSVQFFQQAAFPNGADGIQVVGKVVLRHYARHLHEKSGEVLGGITRAKAVYQSLLDRRLIALLHVPQTDLLPRAAVGVRLVKYIA
jgi:hypothetical protein